MLQCSFERLQKVTGVRQTAQDPSLRSEASSSPVAQTSSHLISYLLCIREAVGCAQCCILICDPRSSASVPSETELIIQQRWTLLSRQVFLLPLIASAQYDRPHRPLPAEQSQDMRAILVVRVPGRTCQSQAGSKDGDGSLTGMETQTLHNQFAGEVRIWKQTQCWFWFEFVFASQRRRAFPGMLSFLPGSQAPPDDALFALGVARSTFTSWAHFPF